MTELTTRQTAQEAIRAALLAVAPDADLDSLDPTEYLRDALGLDSIDFLAFVEQLSTSTGRRIDEDDYDRLSTLDSAVEFLTTPR